MEWDSRNRNGLSTRHYLRPPDAEPALSSAARWRGGANVCRTVPLSGHTRGRPRSGNVVALQGKRTRTLPLQGRMVVGVVGLYLVVVAVVFGVNLLPALGPPTWGVLVLFRLHEHLNIAVLVLLGALAAGLGRLLLALTVRHFRQRLPARRVNSLRAAGLYLSGHRGRSALGLVLFALSPLPSAQLFEAAGALEVPLLPVAGAFFAGRLVSYSTYLTAAGLAQASLGDQLKNSLTSWPSLTLQALLLGAVVLLARVDWTKHLPNSHASV